MGICENVLIDTSALLGIDWLAAIVAAFLSTKTDISNGVLKVYSSSDLSSRMVKLGVDTGLSDGCCGDVHTAVY